jgi:NADH-quinone oxidoreductase subunit N
MDTQILHNLATLTATALSPQWQEFFRLLRPMDLFGVLPIIIVVMTAVGALGLAVTLADRRHEALGLVSVTGLALAFAANWFFWDKGMRPVGSELFRGMFVLDNFTLFFTFIFLAAAAISILGSFRYIDENEAHYSEFYPLILFSVAGMIVMAGASDLLSLFLGIELLSIPVYVLVGMLRHRASSAEGAFKYFILGAFATGFLLFGMAYLYGATGETNMARIADALRKTGGVTSNAYAVIGFVFLLVGLAFKIGLVPFHMWTPDAYEGAPSFITGLMATAVKAAGFAALLRVTAGLLPQGVLGQLAIDWVGILAALAVLTMFVGNLAALTQTRIKRMLAYSSIAHAGYALIGVCATYSEKVGKQAAAGVLFYLVGYTIMTLGAFTIISHFERQNGRKGLSINDYNGLASRRPGLALIMSCFMLSLAGIPPFVGFFGKLYLFKAAVDADLMWLALVGVVNSVISVYYYLSLLIAMYMREPHDNFETKRDVPFQWAVGLTAFAVLYFGLFSGGAWDAALKGAAAILK